MKHRGDFEWQETLQEVEVLIECKNWLSWENPTQP
jgi:hypothetical protein